jgi:soluble lytic murein transglycosylase-like protein
MIKDIAKGYAVKNGLPPALVDAVIKVESDYNPKAVSKKGAAGLMQLMPDALKDMEVSNPFNVEDNIQAGVNILKKLMDKYEWDFKKVLAAYNAGEKAVDKNGNIPPIKETKEYVKKVIDAYIQNIK